MSNYRQDNRSESQFKKDIKECTLIETQLMERYVRWLNANKKTDLVYSFIHNGVDNTGEYIEKNSDIHLDSDFILLLDGKRPRKIELKFSRNNNYTFHIKENHLHYCMNNDICIVNWMGIETNDPKFCILTPRFMKEYSENHKPIMFRPWRKMAYKFISKDMEWKK